MSRKLAIFAGEGQLVLEVAQAALAAGWELQIFLLVARNDLEELPLVEVRLTNPLKVVMSLRKFRPTHICMAGAVNISDHEREGIFGFLKRKPKNGHSSGDTGLSRLIGALEMISGAKVIGVHEIIGDLIAPDGLIAGPELNREQIKNCLYALGVARKIGEIDVGQAVVVAGHRVIGAEDIAGTDALIARVKGFVEQGKTGNGRDMLVLAKAKKPQQPAVADLPAIGPDTINNAHQAGIGIIALDAGNSLLIEKARLIALANELGISVFGARPDDDQAKS
ncbi:hypothetical protein MNBD_ALPHA12-1142 [hydrothermal vent metagenome]|uniref:UDP-2,3-diacylglucosamine pyrophosphatase n=1 Tax=hydrothermal vent metagenome TaxID=652676 RepID=A0A3B0TEJ8_9ZZZZ